MRLGEPSSAVSIAAERRHPRQDIAINIDFYYERRVLMATASLP